MTEHEIRRLDPDDAEAMAGRLAVIRAARARDLPGDPEPTAFDEHIRLTRPWPGQVLEPWIAVVDGRIVGTVVVEFHEIENRHLAMIGGTVHPEFRRRGLGRALWETARRRTAEHGRRTMIVTVGRTVEGGVPRATGGPEFAEALGLTEAHSEVRRRIDLTSVDPAAMSALLAESWGHADGYALRRWINHTPSDLIDGIAYLDGRLLADAPTGDLEIEPMKVDAQRVRDSEAALDARLRTRLHVALVHEETGAVAAWTMLNFGADSREHGFQGITIVDPAHRGRRLGTVAKLELHDYARAVEPGLRTVDTWNAGVNDHMISINERIGFRVLDDWADYQGDVATP